MIFTRLVICTVAASTFAAQFKLMSDNGSAAENAGRKVFSTATSWPPSLANSPLIAMIVTAAFLVCVLLAMQWGYAMIDASHDRRGKSWNHPLTISRLVKLLLLGMLLLITAPRIALLTVWHDMTPYWREWCSTVGWIVYIPAAVMLGYAWWLDRRGRKLEEFLLDSARPASINLDVAPADFRRSALILFVVIVVAFATTYVRRAPEQPYAPVPSINGS